MQTHFCHKPESRWSCGRDRRAARKQRRLQVLWRRQGPGDRGGSGRTAGEAASCGQTALSVSPFGTGKPLRGKYKLKMPEQCCLLGRRGPQTVDFFTGEKAAFSQHPFPLLPPPHSLSPSVSGSQYLNALLKLKSSDVTVRGFILSTLQAAL